MNADPLKRKEIPCLSVDKIFSIFRPNDADIYFPGLLIGERSSDVDAPNDISFVHPFSVDAFIFIFCEEGEMTISYKAEASTAIMLLHTPDEYIAFHPDRIVTVFSGVRTEIPEEGICGVRLVKNGSELSFFSGERHLLSISKDAFRTSVSFGLSSKGEGEVSLEVF